MRLWAGALGLFMLGVICYRAGLYVGYLEGATSLQKGATIPVLGACRCPKGTH